MLSMSIKIRSITDVVVQREILKELMALRKKFQFSVIFITHDLSLLLEIADIIAIMYAGRIVEMAPGKELYRRPRHPYTYGLLNSFPSLRGPQRKLTGIPGTPPDLRAVPAGCAFNPRCAATFAPCTSIFPALRSTAAPEIQVACHLYDPTQRLEGPPEQLDLVARYEEQV